MTQLSWCVTSGETLLLNPAVGCRPVSKDRFLFCSLNSRTSCHVFPARALAASVDRETCRELQPARELTSGENGGVGSVLTSCQRTPRRFPIPLKTKGGARNRVLSNLNSIKLIISYQLTDMRSYHPQPISFYSKTQLLISHLCVLQFLLGKGDTQLLTSPAKDMPKGTVHPFRPSTRSWLSCLSRGSAGRCEYMARKHKADQNTKTT